MKKSILLVLLAMVLVVSMVAFAACGEEEEPEPAPPPPVEPKPEPKPEPEPEPEPVWEWPDRFTVLSMGPTGSAYGATVAWTAELQRDTGMTIRIVSVENQRERYRYMQQGQFDLTPERFPDDLIRAQTEGFAYRDGGPWQQRIVWPCGVLSSGYVVRGDSDVNTPYDLKGKTIGFLVWDPAKTSMISLLAWGNVNAEDVNWVPAAGIQATQTLILDGKADVVFAFPNNPVWFEAEAAPNGIKWLELNSKTDPEAAQRYLEVRPGYVFGPCAAGVPSALGKWMITSVASYLTQEEQDADLIYNMVKWLDENHAKYKDAHAYAPTMTLEYLMRLAEIDFIPLHDGVVQYLEEKGLWTAAHEGRRQQNIDLLTKWVEAYQTAIDTADEADIHVDPENEEWVNLWLKYSGSLPYPPFQYFQGLD